MNGNSNKHKSSSVWFHVVHFKSITGVLKFNCMLKIHLGASHLRFHLLFTISILLVRLHSKHLLNFFQHIRSMWTKTTKSKVRWWLGTTVSRCSPMNSLHCNNHLISTVCIEKNVGIGADAESLHWKAEGQVSQLPHITKHGEWNHESGFSLSIFSVQKIRLNGNWIFCYHS